MLERLIYQQAHQACFLPGQRWITNPMKLMDFYPYSGAVCYGFSFTAADLFLKRKMLTFYRLMIQVNESNKSLPNVIQNVIDKRNELVCKRYPEIRKTIKAMTGDQYKRQIAVEMNITFGDQMIIDEALNVEQKKVFKKKFNEKLYVAFLQEEKTLEETLLTEQDRDLLQIKPLFNAIHLHQYAEHFSDWFETELAPYEQDGEKSFTLVESVNNNTNSHIACVGKFLDAYSKESLMQSLEMFRSTFDQSESKQQISQVIYSPDHAIFVGYDPINNGHWHLININNMPGEIMPANDIERLTSSIMTAFSSKHPIVLSSKIFAYSESIEDIEQMKNSITQLQQTEQWKTVHATTPEKSRIVSSAYKYALLHFASKEGYPNIVDTLLTFTETNPNIMTANGETPLLFAAERGHIDIVNKLLMHNANPNLPNNRGDTPLSFAARSGHADVVAALLPKMSLALLNDKHNRYGETPLYLAASNGHVDTVNALLAHLAIDPNIRHCGQTALYAAAEKGYDNVVKRLLTRADLDPNLQDKNGATALYVAARNGHANVVRTLLNYNVDTKLAFSKSADWLRTFAKNTHTEDAMEKLIQSKIAQGEFESKISVSPYEIAEIMNHKSVIDAFKEVELTKNSNLHSKHSIFSDNITVSTLSRENYESTKENHYWQL